MSTRLSACFSVTRFPARNKYGLSVSYSHKFAVAFGAGSGGFILIIWLHSGVVFVEDAISLRSWSTESVCVCVMVVIARRAELFRMTANIYKG